MAATQTVTGPTPGQFDQETGVLPSKSTAGGPGVGQTTVTFVNAVTNPGAGDIALLTVPAGKTLFITDLVITTTGTGQQLFALKDNTTVIFNAHANSTKGIEALGIESQPTVAGGDTFSLNSPAVTGVVAYFIAGYYQ